MRIKLKLRRCVCAALAAAMLLSGAALWAAEEGAASEATEISETPESAPASSTASSPAAPPASSSTPASSTTLMLDGTQDEWAEPELREAYEFGLTYPAVMGNYKAAITREEFCTIVVRLYEALTGEAAAPVSPNPFTDTSNPEILKANNLKIVFGTAADRFTPYANITRQEICVMIYRALEAAVPGLDRSESASFDFADAGQIDNWAYSAVRFCNKNGIMHGTSTTTIAPLDNTTREQAIALLKRTFVAYVGEGAGAGGAGGEGEGDGDGDGDGEELDIDDDPMDMDVVGDWRGTAADLHEVARPIETIRIKPGATFPDYAGQLKINPAMLELLKRPTTVTAANKGEIKTLMDLGRGYDVFDRYASGLSLKQAVLDTDKLIEAGHIQRSVLAHGDFREIEGNSLENYARDITTKAKVSGGYMGFKASIETSFSSSYRSQNTSYFDTINYLIMHDNLFIRATCDYKQFVLPDVKAILDTGRLGSKAYTATEIFDTFGSYVLVDGIFGGRLEYNVTANSEYCASYNSFKANVKASYNALFASVTAETYIEDEVGEEAFTSNRSTTVITYGGTTSVDGVPLSSSQQGVPQIHAWRDSVPDRPVLVEFGSTGSVALIPIWELCSNAGRAEALKNAFDAYAQGKKMVFPDPRQHVTNIKLIAGKTKEDALSLMKDLAGYINTNVNLGSSGWHIYLIYKLGTDTNSNFEEFYLENTSNSAGDNSKGIVETELRSHNGGNLRTWRRLVFDLNMNTETSYASGIFGQNRRTVRETPYIYLWYTSDQWGVKMITDIQVVQWTTDEPPKDKDGWKYVKWWNTPDPANCNEGLETFNNYTPVYIRYRGGSG